MSGLNYGSFAPTHGQTLGSVVIDGFTFPLEILDLNWSGLHRDAIEVTNMNVKPTTNSTGNVGNKMFIPSAYVDPGMLDLKVLHNPTVKIPITDPGDDGPTGITFMLGPSGSVQSTFAGIGFITDYEITGPLDGAAVTATCKVKLTDLVDATYDALGALEFTPAS